MADISGRLAEKPDPVVLKYLYRPWIAREEGDLPYLTDANLAHVIMLGQTGIIPEGEARALLGLLLNIDGEGAKLFSLDPELEGLYYNYERYVIEVLGPRLGGKMHTGRSRNDLGATTSRMRVRDCIIGLLDQVISFRASLLGKAAENLDTIITGYTHLQPAQPITLGHYLTGIEQALQRDVTRLFNTLQCTNRSCLGAGALAGTGFPVDRALTAKLLGFDGFLENTLDAVGGRDYLLELYADLAILATTLSRLAQDLYAWYTYEFGIITLPDRLGGTSSIMPQKKNPIIMEATKGRAAHVIGGLISALGAMKNTNYTNVIDVNSEGFYLLDDSINHTEAMLALLEAVIEGMEVRRQPAYERAAENFSTVTELADALVRQKDCSFREAHHAVGVIVRKAMESGLKATQVTSEFIDRVVSDELGEPLGLPEESVRQALDPKHNVAARAHPGGPAPDAVRKTIESATSRLQEDRQRLGETRTQLDNARLALRSAALEMIEDAS
jgi:argininosuccinate lyase